MGGPALSRRGVRLRCRFCVADFPLPPNVPLRSASPAGAERCLTSPRAAGRQGDRRGAASWILRGETAEPGVAAPRLTGPLSLPVGDERPPLRPPGKAASAAPVHVFVLETPAVQPLHPGARARGAHRFSCRAVCPPRFSVLRAHGPSGHLPKWRHSSVLTGALGPALKHIIWLLLHFITKFRDKL